MFNTPITTAAICNPPEIPAPRLAAVAGKSEHQLAAPGERLILEYATTAWPGLVLKLAHRRLFLEGLFPRMSHPLPQLAKSELDRLRVYRLLPNLLKIPLFVGLMGAFTLIAWNTESQVVLWSAYVVLGYLWMGMVTFMHD